MRQVYLLHTSKSYCYLLFWTFVEEICGFFYSHILGGKANGHENTAFGFPRHIANGSR